MVQRIWYYSRPEGSGRRFNNKMTSYQYRKFHWEIRRSYDRLISTMGFPILVRRHLYIESGTWLSFDSIPPHDFIVVRMLIQQYT